MHKYWYQLSGISTDPEIEYSTCTYKIRTQCNWACSCVVEEVSSLIPKTSFVLYHVCRPLSFVKFTKQWNFLRKSSRTPFFLKKKNNFCNKNLCNGLAQYSVSTLVVAKYNHWHSYSLSVKNKKTKSGISVSLPNVLHFRLNQVYVSHKSILSNMEYLDTVGVYLTLWQ